MANTSFNHDMGDVSIDPLTGDNSRWNGIDELRVKGHIKAGDPRDMYAPNRDWQSQEISRRLAKERERLENKRNLDFNPVMDSIIATAPDAIKGKLREARGVGLFTELGKKAWSDPVIQAKYGNVPLAFQRMQSTGIDFLSTQGGPTGRGVAGTGGVAPGDIQGAVQRHHAGMEHAEQLSSSITKRWAQNKADYSGGLNLEQTLNISGYMARQGGNHMNRADMTAEDKAHGMRNYLQSTSRAMQVFQTDDAEKALKKIKELSGKDLSSLSPQEAKQLNDKLKKMGDMSVALGRSSEEMGNTAIEMRKAFNVAGLGNVQGYTSSSGASKFGNMESNRAINLAYASTVTSNNRGESVDERRTRNEVMMKHKMRVDNTEGGRLAILAANMHGAGEIDDETMRWVSKTMSTGGDRSKIIDKLSKVAGTDVGSKIKSDEDMAEMIASRRKGMSTETQEKTDRAADELQDQAYQSDQKNIAQTKAMKADSYNTLEKARKHGSLSTTQQKAASDQAKELLYGAIARHAAEEVSTTNPDGTVTKKRTMTQAQEDAMRAKVARGDWSGLAEGANGAFGKGLAAKYDAYRNIEEAKLLNNTKMGAAGATTNDLSSWKRLLKVSDKDLDAVGKGMDNPTDAKFEYLKGKLEEAAKGGNVEAQAKLDDLESYKESGANKVNTQVTQSEKSMTAQTGATAPQREIINNQEKGPPVTTSAEDAKKKTEASEAAAGAKDPAKKAEKDKKDKEEEEAKKKGGGKGKDPTASNNMKLSGWLEIRGLKGQVQADGINDGSVV